MSTTKKSPLSPEEIEATRRAFEEGKISFYGIDLLWAGLGRRKDKG